LKKTVDKEDKVTTENALQVTSIESIGSSPLPIGWTTFSIPDRAKVDP